MTCVVMVQDPVTAEIYGAADKRISTGDEIQNSKSPKLWKTNTPWGAALIGVAGDLAVINRVRHAELFDEELFGAAYDHRELHKYMETTFGKKVAECLVDLESPEWQVAVALYNNLYVVDSNLATLHANGAVIAIGSGSEVALGAAQMALAYGRLDTSLIPVTAVEIAARHCASVGGEVVTESTVEVK